MQTEVDLSGLSSLEREGESLGGRERVEASAGGNSANWIIRIYLVSLSLSSLPSQKNSGEEWSKREREKNGSAN